MAKDIYPDDNMFFDPSLARSNSQRKQIRVWRNVLGHEAFWV